MAASTTCLASTSVRFPSQIAEIHVDDPVGDAVEIGMILNPQPIRPLPARQGAL
jgi:hypothetical protein